MVGCCCSGIFPKQVSAAASTTFGGHCGRGEVTVRDCRRCCAGARGWAQQLCPWGLPKGLPGRGEGSSSSSCGSCQPCLSQVTISMSPLVPGDEWGQTRSVPTIGARVWLRFKKGSQDWGHCRESHAWLGMVGHAWV